MDTDKEKKETGLTKKQELNNHIVLMRKAVKQAKVHVVRKLTREVSRLRERKGSEEIRTKCQRKAERLHQEIISIKNLEQDQVSIAALTNTTSLVDVLQKPQSSAEDRARSRLIHHTAVQTQVKKYRDANPHWRLQIPVLLEKNPQKSKKAEKKRAEKLARKKKPSEPQQNSAADSNNKSADSSAAPESESEKKENVPAELKPSDQATPAKPKQQKKVTKGSKEVKPVPEKPKPKSKVDEILATIPLKKQVSEEKLNKVKGSVKVQLLKSLDDLESESKVQTDETKVKEKPKVKPKSSFFLGGEDDNEEESKEEPEDSEGEGRTLRSRLTAISEGRGGKHPKTNKFKDTKSPKGFKGKPFASKPPARHFDKPSNRLDKPSRDLKKPAVQAVAPAPAEKLHPSWEAKKRQSISITPFQGKKIKFDD